jgi:hypothetical protein
MEWLERDCLCSVRTEGCQMEWLERDCLCSVRTEGCQMEWLERDCPLNSAHSTNVRPSALTTQGKR